MRGLLGNDYLNGNDGDDELYGEFGADELHGESGNDELNGGHGTDTVYGQDGDDILFDPSADVNVWPFTNRLNGGGGKADRCTTTIQNDKPNLLAECEILTR